MNEKNILGPRTWIHQISW